MITRRAFLKSASAFSLLSAGGLKVFGGSYERPVVRFGLVTDSHYADREVGGIRYYRQSLDKMKACVEVMNKEGVDFLMHLGDFKDQDKTKNPEKTLSYLREIEAAYAQFDGPRFHAIGNHDVDSISKQQFLDNIENTGISKEKSYYSFDKGDWHFVVLDPNYHVDGRHHNKGDFKWYEAYVPADQLAWLKRDLANTKLPTVVFSHQLLHELKAEPKSYHITNCEALRKLLEESAKVAAVFQGHYHQSNYLNIKGIHYDVLLAMVDFEGLENNSFAIIEGFSNGDLQVNGYKRVPDNQLKNRIKLK